MFSYGIGFSQNRRSVIMQYHYNDTTPFRAKIRKAHFLNSPTASRSPKAHRRPFSPVMSVLGLSVAELSSISLP